MIDFVKIRKDLHAHPGVSGCEDYAHDKIVSTLQQLHPTKVYDHVEGCGVIAVWDEVCSRPTIAFRADIDALPIGHRCGHDGHTAILLRFAQKVDELWPSMKGKKNVILIFQPAEETGYGAQQILDSGILQNYNIKAIYGLHNLPGIPLGQVVLNMHTFAAASTGVVFCLQGRETHASTPEKGLNPGLAVAEMIRQMAELNNGSADLDKFWQTTLICVRVGEEAFGTSAGSAQVMFTLRAFTNSAMEQLLFRSRQIAQDIAVRHHLELHVELRDPFRATENTPQLVEQLEEIFPDCTYRLEPFRWSEDFANYLVHFPGCFFGIGSGKNQPELHHPNYEFPDALIEPAAQAFADILMNNN